VHTAARYVHNLSTGWGQTWGGLLGVARIHAGLRGSRDGQASARGCEAAYTSRSRSTVTSVYT
jgi:hypothetical protein